MQRTFRIFIVFVVASIALLGLGACESGKRIMAEYGFAGGGTVENTGQSTGPFAAIVDSSRLIYIVPVEGVSSPARLVMADAIAASLRDAGQPAILAEKINEFGPTVTGRILEANERGSVVWVTALWELRAPYGTAVAEYRQQVVVDAGLWNEGSVEVINLLVTDAAPRVLALINDYVSPMSPISPVNEEAALTPEDIMAALAPGGIPAAPVPVPVLATPAPPVTTPTPRKLPARPLVKNKAVPPAFASLPPKAAPEPVKKPANKPGRPKILMEIPDPASKPPKALKPEKKAKKRKSILMPVPTDGPSPIIADPPPVSWARPAFLIKMVRGAPGDGNKALTKAMKKALRKSDITVTEDPRQAGFVIEGRVEISTPINGRQQAKIVWAVNTIDGDEVGKAIQENAIKAGSLDGAWGRIADIVSSAAITGIQELFGIEKKQSFRRNKNVKFTNKADMPRVPGRALPPP